MLYSFQAIWPQSWPNWPKWPHLGPLAAILVNILQDLSMGSKKQQTNKQKKPGEHISPWNCLWRGIPNLGVWCFGQCPSRNGSIGSSSTASQNSLFMTVRKTFPYCAASRKLRENTHALKLFLFFVFCFDKKGLSFLSSFFFSIQSPKDRIFSASWEKWAWTSCALHKQYVQLYVVCLSVSGPSKNMISGYIAHTQWTLPLQETWFLDSQCNF